METLVDPPFTSSELRDGVGRLYAEKVFSSRKKILKEICCRAPVSSATLHPQYSEVELSEWRTCVIEAADGPTKLSKGMHDIFMLYSELAVKVGNWCIKITSAHIQDCSSQRDSLAEVIMSQQAVIRLTSTVFEAVADLYLSGQTTLFREPSASTLETLVSNAFELVRLIHVSIMKKPSSQPGDDDMLRKRCQELLGVTYRLVHIFRRQVGDRLPETNGDFVEESSPGSTWPHVPTALRIVASSIQSFALLGQLSSSRGERSLALLNISWKSILTLLQVDEGRDAVASVVDIPSLVVTLISNAVLVTKRAIETWIVKCTDFGQKEARKLCIPIKFFLMTAMKISSVYPQKVVMVNNYMISFASKVNACLLHKDLIAHKEVTEAFSEFVVPSAFALLHNLLNDRSVNEDLKIQIVRDITMDCDELEISQAITDLDGCAEGNEIVDELFGNKLALCPGAGLLRTGKVVLFLSVLRASDSFSNSLVYELLAKLRWLLDEIPKERMYMLMTQTRYLPVDRSDMSGKWKWQVTFLWVSHAIEVFSAVTAKEDPTWTEFKYFLFDEVLHPSVICGEVVLNVWSFIIRQSDPEMARDHVSSLLSILREVNRMEGREYLQRRLGRAICVLLQAAPDSVASELCNTNPFHSDEDATVITQLLQEGLPLSKLGSNNLLSCCIACGKGLVDSLKVESCGLHSQFNVPKRAIRCLSLIISQSACRGESIEDKYLEEIKQIVACLISMYTFDYNKSRIFHSQEIIGPTLELIPHIQHLLDPTKLEELLPRLLEICLTTPESSNYTKDLKQSLPEFLANLSDVSIQEDESNPAMKALWSLYHLVLREKPWALIHMGLLSFAHFAAHTSCQELWRFVPPDAAVVSDGNGDNDFMTALKVFIEKECAILSRDSSAEELQLLRIESNLQEQKHKKILAKLKVHMDVDTDVKIQDSTKLGTKPTSDSSEIQEAVAMLCKGIGVLKDRAPGMLKGEASQQWEALRSRLEEMNEQVQAFQRRDR